MLWDKDAEAAGWVWGALGAASVWIRLGGDSWRGSCCQFFEGAVFAKEQLLSGVFLRWAHPQVPPL